LLDVYSTCKVVELGDLHDGDEVLIGGIINKARLTVTRRTQEKMAIATLEDLSGMVEVLIFPSTFSKCGTLVKPDTIVFVKGRLNLREEEPKIVADEVTPLDQVKSKYTKAISISLVTTGLEKSTLEDLKRILTRYPGSVPVLLNFLTPEGERVKVATAKNILVEPHDGLVKDIEKVFGKDVVSFKI
jgi:DNA polymerase-3 subunit alpha